MKYASIKLCIWHTNILCRNAVFRKVRSNKQRELILVLDQLTPLIYQVQTTESWIAHDTPGMEHLQEIQGTKLWHQGDILG